MSSLPARLGDARIGFGTMRLCGEGCWGEPADRPGAIAVLRRAAELGVRLFDTADCYGPGVAEELLADALAPYADEVVVATKAGVRHPGPGRWEPDARPERLRECCEASLRRLRVERLDLLQLHTVDPQVPLEESIGALAELRAEGLVAEVGLSNVTVEQLETARAIVPIAAVQNRYHLLDRGSQDVLEHCARHDIAFLAWRPLAMLDADLRGRIEAIEPRHPAAITTLAWLLQRSHAMCPIPGTSTITHLEQNMRGGDVELDESTVAALDALVRA